MPTDGRMSMAGQAHTRMVGHTRTWVGARKHAVEKRDGWVGAPFKPSLHDSSNTRYLDFLTPPH